MEATTLQEISRHSIVISKYVETCLHWSKSLAVRIDKGISVIDFCHDFSCVEKKLNTKESTIPCPKSSPASKLFSPNFRNKMTSNFNVNQMFIDPILWPANPELMNELICFISCEWSPPNFLCNNECILATLSNMGNIEMFGLQRMGWTSILNLSLMIENYHEKIIISKSKTLEEIKKDAQTLETSAFCWGKSFEDYCYFVTAQKNSDILIWCLKSKQGILKPELLSNTNVGTSEIISVFWIQKTDHKYTLIYSNLLGQLFAMDCEVNSKKMSTKNTHILWEHDDRMIVKLLTHIFIDGKLVILFVKYRHLVVQVLDDENNVLSQYFTNVNDDKITVLTEYNHIFYICTVNCKIYKVTMFLTTDNVSLELNSITLKNSFAHCDLYGFAISNNGALYALALLDKKLRYRKEIMSLDVVFLAADDNINKELFKLIDNPTKSLSGMWDCIELLRYKTMKSKMLPDIDYLQVFTEPNMDLYNLKLYLILLKFHKTLVELCVANKTLLPETSIEKIKETILFKHAQAVLNDLFKSYQENGEFVEIEKKTFLNIKHFLKYYCNKYKLNLEDHVNIDVFDVITVSNKDFKCECCNEIMDTMLCRNNHFNMICCVTFTQITDDDYMFCKICDSTATIELLGKKPKCTFCDIYLDVF